MSDKGGAKLFEKLHQFKNPFSPFSRFALACFVTLSSKPLYELEKEYFYSILCCVTLYYKRLTSTNGRSRAAVVQAL